jgi:hypothetical protein
MHWTFPDNSELHFVRAATRVSPRFPGWAARQTRQNPRELSAGIGAPLGSDQCNRNEHNDLRTFPPTGPGQYAENPERQHQLSAVSQPPAGLFTSAVKDQAIEHQASSHQSFFNHQSKITNPSPHPCFSPSSSKATRIDAENPSRRPRRADPQSSRTGQARRETNAAIPTQTSLGYNTRRNVRARASARALRSGSSAVRAGDS